MDESAYFSHQLGFSLSVGLLRSRWMSAATRAVFHSVWCAALSLLPVAQRGQPRSALKSVCVAVAANLQESAPTERKKGGRVAGDQMTISFDTAAKKIASVKVNTYMDEPKDAVTFAVQFASLPDSTNYVQQTVLNATAKTFVVTTTNSDYKALGTQ